MTDMAVLSTPTVVPASELLASPQSAWLGQWSDFAVEARSMALPDVVIDRAKLVLLDSIGAIAGGMQEPELQALVEAEATADGVTLIGTGRKAPQTMAAFVNGVAGTTLELDEGNQFARGHPGIHVVPALLALAREEQTGDTLLRALVLGYEIGSRIGIASKLRVTMHPHGTWGTVGAAVGAASLAGSDAAAIANIINIAANLSLATSRRTMLEGATVRNCFSGLSNQLGLMANTLHRSGFVGERDAVATVYDSIVADDFQPDEMVAELGERWEIARNYFKMHAACRYTHAALDVVTALMAEHVIDPAQVSDIKVDTYCWAAQLDHPEPGTMLAAKFSIPFAVATTLVHGAAAPDAFRRQARSNPVIADLASRVQVREDVAMTASLPAERPARVTVTMKDGQQLSGTARVNRGDTEHPYGTDEIFAKFHSLTDPVWGSEGASRIRNVVMTIDQADSLNGLLSLLSMPPLSHRV
jgi:2-methylcitrate dehydratase PrpD